MQMPLAFTGRNSEYRVTLKRGRTFDVNHFMAAKMCRPVHVAEEAANLRLRGSSDAKTYEGPQEQEPAVHRSEGAQQAVVQSQAHAKYQSLFTTERYTEHTWVKHQILYKHH